MWVPVPYILLLRYAHTIVLMSRVLIFVCFIAFASTFRFLSLFHSSVCLYLFIYIQCLTGGGCTKRARLRRNTILIWRHANHGRRDERRREERLNRGWLPQTTIWKGNAFVSDSLFVCLALLKRQLALSLSSFFSSFAVLINTSRVSIVNQRGNQGS